MPDLSFTAKPARGAKVIYEELPTEGLGTVRDKYWRQTFGHFSQQQFSQALGFPPGAEITIENVSSSQEHTLNVIGEIKGPPAKFPTNPSLPTTPSGGRLQVGYASGIIYPLQSVTVKLGKPGIYLVGCAIHYHSYDGKGMKDVIVVGATATPGPEGTAPPTPTPMPR